MSVFYTVYEYVTAPRGKVHLVRQDENATHTLCGRLIVDGWQDGDETVSGHLAARCCTRRMVKS